MNNLSTKERELIERMINLHFCKAVQIVTIRLILLEQNENKNDTVPISEKDS